MLVLQVCVFAIAAWLGAHLLARSPRKPAVRWAAIGAFGCALAIAADAVGRGLANQDHLRVASFALFVVPMVAWPLVLARLAEPSAVTPAWQRRLLVLSVVSLIVAGGLAFADRSANWVPGVLAVVPVLAFAVTFPRIRHRRVRSLSLVATLLFGLGLSFPAYAAELLPDGLLLPMLGVDLIVLAVAVAIADAFDEGTELRADMARSAIFSGLAGLVFGGQVGLAFLVTGTGPAMTALLFGVVAAAVTGQSVHGVLNRTVDRLAFAGRPETVREREELREAADALARRPEPSAFAFPPDREFTRLVRRALSDYAHLGRLVASPLTGLPVIGERLAARGSADQPLERAAELKAVLREGIERLRPQPGQFSTADEWRFFNAVHYPYVVGLRPYSVRARHENLSPDAAAVLTWFRAGVPERTLHNWQNQAAALIAADLKGRAGADSAVSGSVAPVPGSAS
ncbi:hypothetical protein [Phytomonospora endophytica]|uniref:Uncharacterized protein n=1 Tax=Phytomonospora endophytica TaxID=714109 RepID=A0A841FZH6_9ACTN|nr:hypothetical protein [Phytomonospora endophytica]MBB6037340.1 hypothetical protein [Phytomonospora endophytica]